MNRRDFLNITGGTIGANSVWPGFNASTAPSWFDLFKMDTDKVLVIIQLEGGNDGLNTLIPLDQHDLYTKARSTVAITADKILKINSTNTIGLHPAMDEIKGLYNEGRIAFIQSVGYPSPNYSHFRSTDIWMTGADSDEILSTGWAGRYLNYEFPNFPNGFPNNKMPDPLSVEIGYGQSLNFQGPITNMSVTIADPDSFNKLIQGIETPLPQSLYGEKLGYVRLIKKQSNIYGEQMKKASMNAKNMVSYPDDNYLAEQLKIVARLIAGGLKTRIYKVSISGFDTHDNQVANDHSKGEHYQLWRNISSAIKTFMDDLHALRIQDRVIGMTVSEFGRRIISNASRGTDHGAAAPMMLFGNAIKGGILGSNPIIPMEATENDNIPMQYDFRSLYGSVLEEWFCVSNTEVKKALTKDYQTLRIINPNYSCISTPTHEESIEFGLSLISLYPNPFTTIINLTVKGNGKHVLISIFSPNGQIIKTIYQGILVKGDHHFYWNAENLPDGNYYVRCQLGEEQQIKLISKVK